MTLLLNLSNALPVDAPTTITQNILAALGSACVWTISGYMKEFGDFAFARTKSGFNSWRNNMKEARLKYNKPIMIVNVPVSKISTAKVK